MSRMNGWSAALKSSDIDPSSNARVRFGAPGPLVPGAPWLSGPPFLVVARILIASAMRKIRDTATGLQARGNALSFRQRASRRRAHGADAGKPAADPRVEVPDSARVGGVGRRSGHYRGAVGDGQGRGAVQHHA